MKRYGCLIAAVVVVLIFGMYLVGVYNGLVGAQQAVESEWAQVQAAWYQARNRLLAHPVNGTIGADEFDDTFLQGGYLDELWPGFAQALSSYLNFGQADDLITQYQGYGKQSENEFAVYNAVQCSDVNWPRNWSFWTSDTKRVYAKAPFQAWDNAWFNAACAFWPVQGPAKPLQVKGAQVRLRNSTCPIVWVIRTSSCVTIGSALPAPWTRRCASLPCARCTART